MIGLVILLVLVLLVLAVAFLRLGAAAGYDETGGWVKVRVGPAWLTLYPLSEEKKRKREAKAEKKAAKKKKRTAEPQENKKTPRRKTLKNAFSPGGALDLALDLLPKLKEMAGDLRHTIRIDTLSLHLVWGEPDPADAAMHYGQAWGVLEALLAFTEANFTVKNRDLSVALDYQIESPRLTVEAACSISVAQLLSILWPILKEAIRGLWKRKKQAHPKERRSNARLPWPPKERKRPMEKNHPVSELMAETIQKIKEAVDANTVVGQPITAGEVTIIPVSRISLGFGTGGSEFGGKAPKNLGENPFGGGGGAGLKVIPVGFLVVSGTSVKMLPVDTATESPADRLVELIPDLLEQVSKKWEERKAKKQAEPEITEEDLV